MRKTSAFFARRFFRERPRATATTVAKPPTSDRNETAKAVVLCFVFFCELFHCLSFPAQVRAVGRPPLRSGWATAIGCREADEATVGTPGKFGGPARRERLRDTRAFHNTATTSPATKYQPATSRNRFPAKAIRDTCPARRRRHANGVTCSSIS